ncbi:MAG: TlpA family protein disulfide reductase [Proteobacteria bacterium]|nr:TlpA family protein disulfide reductase [Pseudomonadota bacterium]
MNNINVKKLILILVFILLISTKTAFAKHEFTVFSNPKSAPVSLFSNSYGEKQTLENYGEKVIILSFWDLSCKPCILEMPLLNRLQKKFRHKNVIILPISRDSSAVSQIRSFYRRYKLKNLSYLIDSGNFTGSSFGVEAIPSSFIINKKGQLVAKAAGLINWLAPENMSFIENLTNQN